MDALTTLVREFGAPAVVLVVMALCVYLIVRSNNSTMDNANSKDQTLNRIALQTLDKVLELSATNTQLSKSVGALEEKTKRLESDLALMTNEFDNVNKARQEADTKVKELIEEIRVLKSGQTADNKRLTDENTSLRNEVKELTTKNTELEKKVASLENEMATLRTVAATTTITTVNSDSVTVEVPTASS